MTTKRYQYGERDLTVAQWFKEPEVAALGIARETFGSRLNRGWPIARAISEPCDAAHRNGKSVAKPEKRNGRQGAVYLPADLLEAVLVEAARLKQPVSWVVQKCVKKALPRLRAYPSPDEIVLVQSPEEERAR